MKKTIVTFAYCSLFVFTLASSLHAKISTTYPNQKEPVVKFEFNSIILPASTSVSLRLTEAISSEDVEVGNTVYLQVYKNVVVNNVVVIAGGSFAEGRITKVQKACNVCNGCKSSKNGCSMVEIVVETVQAVDGSSVNLNAIPHRVKGQCCGTGPTMVDIGAKISAKVLDNTTIYL